MRKLLIVATLAVMLVTPTVLATHDPDHIESTHREFTFNPIVTGLEISPYWAGIGGPGNGPGERGALVPAGSLDESATDDCADLDNPTPFPLFGVLIAFPSVVTRAASNEIVIPGTSVPAPDAATQACQDARHEIFGEPEDHSYTNDPQRVGTSGLTVRPFGIASFDGVFDNDVRALPDQFRGSLCLVDTGPDWPGTSSTGNEIFANFGAPHASLAGSDSVACSYDTFTQKVLTPVKVNGGQWQTGTINIMAAGGPPSYRLDVSDPAYTDDFPGAATGMPNGLFAMCLYSPVEDLDSAAVGFFEDYGYFWVDSAGDGFPFASQWSQRENWDSRSQDQACSDVTGMPHIDDHTHDHDPSS